MYTKVSIAILGSRFQYSFILKVLDVLKINLIMLHTVKADQRIASLKIKLKCIAFSSWILLCLYLFIVDGIILLGVHFYCISIVIRFIK